MGEENGSSRPSPRERYEEFARENEAWDRKVNEALDDLDELIEDGQSSKAAEPTPAKR
jgi:hypothetical protein